MLRLILVFVFVSAVIWAIQVLIKTYKRPRLDNRQPPKGEAMIQCAHCGVHLPQSQSIHQQGQDYCCQEHAQLGPKS